MKCPYCQSLQIFVVNSRPTKGETQIWRRRLCRDCGQKFTTHEVIDLSHLVVIKKSGRKERFSRIKLYSGIYGATIGAKIPNREKFVDKITFAVENEVLSLKRKKITSDEIAGIVLKKLRRAHSSVFLRFLSYCKDIQTEAEMRRELNHYLPVE